MSYQLKRINPYWHTHPMIPTAVAIGGICALVGYKTQNHVIALLGGLVAAGAILAAARPVISAMLAALGFFGGIVQFLVVMNLEVSQMTVPMRLLSAFLFGVFYMVLMDALVLVVAVLYNLFAGTVGFSGLTLELETVEEEAAGE